MEKVGSRILWAGLILASMLCGCVSYPVPVAPPLREEVIGVEPYVGAVWVPGNWVWERRHREYRWNSGHWRHGRGRHRR